MSPMLVGDGVSVEIDMMTYRGGDWEQIDQKAKCLLPGRGLFGNALSRWGDPCMKACHYYYTLRFHQNVITFYTEVL